MSKLRQMYDGWINLLLSKFSEFRDEEIEKMAEERLKHCEVCKIDGEDGIEYIMKTATIMGKKFDVGLYPHCKICWCETYALIRSPEKHCEKGKF